MGRGDRVTCLCTGAGGFMEDYNAAVACPIWSPPMRISEELALSCTPPPIYLLLGSCLWRGWGGCFRVAAGIPGAPRVGGDKTVASLPYPCSGIWTGGNYAM